MGDVGLFLGICPDKYPEVELCLGPRNRKNATVCFIVS